MMSKYVIESRIAGKTPWANEGSGDSWASLDAAEVACESLRRREPVNEEGDPLEYRVAERGQV